MAALSPMTRDTVRRIHQEIGREGLEEARGLVRVLECNRARRELSTIMEQERWEDQVRRVVGHLFPRNPVRCQLLIGLSIFNPISSSIGKVSIVSLLADRAPATLLIERECSLSVKVPFRRRRDRDN